MNYMKFQDGGFESMMRSQAQSDPTKKKGFTLTGQYAGSVEQEGADKQYVMYDMPDGSKVKVYGNWNEYAVARDENGKDMIADDDYPITLDEEGNYVLDERRYEEMMMHDGEGPDDMGEPPMNYDEEEDPTQKMRNETKGGMGASPMEDLMEKLNQAGAKRQSYADGGKFKKYTGKPEDPTRKMAREARGGQGASAIEDLMERLNQYGQKRKKYNNGGKLGGESVGISNTSDLLSALNSFDSSATPEQKVALERYYRDQLQRKTSGFDVTGQKIDEEREIYRNKTAPLKRDLYLSGYYKMNR